MYDQTYPCQIHAGDLPPPLRIRQVHKPPNYKAYVYKLQIWINISFSILLAGRKPKFPPLYFH